MPMPSQATSTSGSAKLSVRGVGKRYDLGNRMTVEAVRDVSFDVTEGEICALLGPSGCGKSTVLRMVAGLEDPSSGAMFLDGKEIHGPDKSRGMVFQRYTLIRLDDGAEERRVRDADQRRSQRRAAEETPIASSSS